MSRTIKLSPREKLDINQQNDVRAFLERYHLENGNGREGSKSCRITRRQRQELFSFINGKYVNMPVKPKAVKEYCDELLREIADSNF